MKTGANFISAYFYRKNFKHYRKDISTYYFRDNDTIAQVDIHYKGYVAVVHQLILDRYNYDNYETGIKNNSIKLNDDTLFSFDISISKEEYERIKTQFFVKQRELEDNRNQELVKSALSLGVKEKVISDKELFEKFCSSLIEKNPNFFNQTEKGLQVFSAFSYNGPTKLIYEKFGEYFYFINDREMNDPGDYFGFKNVIIEISKSYISKYESVQDEFFIKLNNLLENK